jgi:hypothetical protein
VCTASFDVDAREFGGWVMYQRAGEMLLLLRHGLSRVDS